jgi:hypothetical protein
MELLLRGSRDGFGCEVFHQKCDNIEDTVTLVRTEFGKTISGFTHYPWNSANTCVNDEGKRAFLLQLDLKEKYVPKDGNKLIYYDKAFNPRFG